MGRLDNTEFLKQVSDILTTNNGKSSVYLTQKRLSPALAIDADTNNTINDLSSNVKQTAIQNTTTYPILIRVSLNGKDRKDKKDKVKLSTVVETDRLDQFWTEYVHVIKTGFTGLKKKTKKSKKSGKVSK
ncbi:signal recognition particle, SRP9/SRP14 subunit [Scheffersomyces xylosifermentans]|uniref:signal recognition particle, SRP9/SRP14 subunit n=1 Tax=Scheffersomyces xylosifermentans TaxID=1304137 RepID=UPI00315D1B30